MGEVEDDNERRSRFVDLAKAHYQHTRGRKADGKLQNRTYIRIAMLENTSLYYNISFQNELLYYK